MHTEGIAVVSGEDDQHLVIGAPSLQIRHHTPDLRIDLCYRGEIHAQAGFEFAPGPPSGRFGAMRIMKRGFPALIFVERRPGRDGEVAVVFQKFGGRMIVGVRPPIIELVIEGSSGVEKAAAMTERPLRQKMVECRVNSRGHLVSARVVVENRADAKIATAGAQPSPVLRRVQAHATVPGKSSPS